MQETWLNLSNVVAKDVLVFHNIEPPCVFSANFNFGTDQGEAAVFVQDDGRSIFAHDARDERMKTRFTTQTNEFAQQRTSRVATSSVSVYINRVFDGGGVGRSFAKC